MCLEVPIGVSAVGIDLFGAKCALLGGTLGWLDWTRYVNGVEEV